MEVIRDSEKIKRVPDGVVTVGTFDGIHLAHRAIIDKVVRFSKEKNVCSTVVTFQPHPRLVIAAKDGKKVELISSTEEKIEILESLGVNRVIIIPFTLEFSQTPANIFLEEILCKKIGLQKLVIGYDHGFGRGRSGGIEMLIQSGNECGFDVEVVEPIANDLGIISSTLVRAFLKNGNVKKAAVCLNRNYQISGKVVKGDGRGRKLNYPTANIEVNDTSKCVPAHGVYVVRVSVENRRYYGVMNIGLRPTFAKNEESLEVHIFDFDENIYKKNIKVEFLVQLRKEKKFDSPEELKKQIKSDVLVAKEYLFSQKG